MPRGSTTRASVRTWTPSSTRTPLRVPEPRHARGIIDTSVVIDPLAELPAGPHATADSDERARRQDRLQRAEAAFDPLPVDAEVARAYGRVYATVAASGRKARGRRAVDLLIAATALAAGLPLYTRNPGDFQGLGGLVEIVSVAAAGLGSGP
ncbi:MAG: PIN domain-containing protein [Thermoleophilaceae bacterium]